MQIELTNTKLNSSKIEKDVHTIMRNEKRDHNCFVTVDYYVDGVVKTLTFKGDLLGFTGAITSEVGNLSAISTFLSESEKCESTDLTKIDGVSIKTVKPTSIPSQGKRTNGLHG